jgi:hypothetical protein
LLPYTSAKKPLSESLCTAAVDDGCSELRRERLPRFDVAPVSVFV